jgi:hypothetical protein
MAPIPITRAEYEARFGRPPVVTPIPITRAEYAAKFGKAEEQDPERLLNFGRSVAKGASSLIGIANDIGNLPRNIGASIASWLTDGPETNFFSGSQLTDALRRSYVDEPVATDTTQRYLNSIGEMLPSAAIPGGGLGLRVLSALGAGVGSQGARDIGAPEWVGALAGGVAPNVASGVVKAATRPFYQSGREVLAGKTLLANAGQEGKARLLNNLDDVASYAEVANTPTAAAFQTSLRKIPGEGKDIMERALVDVPSQQAKSLLSRLAPGSLDDVSQVVRGEELQAAIVDQVKKAWDSAGEAFEALQLPAKAKISVSKASKEISSLYDEMFGAGALSPDSDVVKIVSKLTSEKKLPFKTIKALQTETGATIGKIARTNSKATELPVLYKIKEALNTAIDDAVTSGKVLGLSKEKIAAYKLAKANYAKTGKIYGSKLIKDLTKRGDFGSLEAGSPASAVVPKITRTPESAKQFMRAFGADKDLVTKARAGLVDSTLTGPIESWPNKFAKKKDVFKELFGDDYKEVEQLIATIARRNNVGTLATRASRGQSATQEFRTQAEKLLVNGPRSIMRLIGSKVATGTAVGTGALTGNIFLGLGAAGMSRVINWAENNIELLLQRAMVEPELRKMLLQKATIAGQRRMMERIIPLAAQIMTTQDKDLELPEPIKEKLQKVAAIEPAMTKAARATTVPEKLIQAVIKQESAGNPRAVSNKGARGLMQLMPATAAEVAKELGIKEYDLEDPETNVRFGAHYLKKQLDRFGDIELALAAYNAGPARVADWQRKYGETWREISAAIKREDPKHETLTYVPKILGYYKA